LVNETAAAFAECDGIVIGSPVYYSSPNGNVLSFMDRLFYSTSFDKTMKVGAVVVSARRTGCSSTFDVLNKYFSISGMPVAPSQYWNEVHGYTPDDVRKDEEGMQTMRVLGRNMAFLMKSIALGKERYGLPEKEPRVFTHFIR
jgi:multimeric flavodoxin WrbA